MITIRFAVARSFVSYYNALVDDVAARLRERTESLIGQPNTADGRARIEREMLAVLGEHATIRGVERIAPDRVQVLLDVTPPPDHIEVHLVV